MHNQEEKLADELVMGKRKKIGESEKEEIAKEINPHTELNHICKKKQCT